MQSISIKRDNKEIESALDFIEGQLSGARVSSKYIMQTQMLAEDVIATMVEVEPEGGDISIYVYKSMGLMTVRLESEGQDISSRLLEQETQEDMDIKAHNALAAVRRILFTAHQDKYKFAYKNGVNTVTIIAGEPYKRQARVSVYSMLLAVIVAVVLRLLFPAEWIASLNSVVLSPVTDIFINLLNMVVAPLVFFSIASSMGTITDFNELGKVGRGIILFYLATTFMAIMVGLTSSSLVKICGFGDLSYLSDGVVSDPGQLGNISDFIVSMFPNNFFEAFVESNTLEVIVLAILVGIATAKMGEYTQHVSKFLDIANRLFLTITSLITEFIPIMIFCSLLSLIATADLSTLGHLAKFLIASIITLLCMPLVYMLVILVTTRQNPLKIMKEFVPVYLTAFNLRSSSATIPTSMKICDKALKISPKVYTFSIPLGATINMDGSSVFMILSAMFFAQAFGVQIDPSQIGSMIAMIVFMSMAMPGTVGGGVAMYGALYASVGIPDTALTILIAILNLTDPIITSSNVMGDMTGTYVVAKRNGYVRE